MGATHLDAAERQGLAQVATCEVVDVAHARRNAACQPLRPLLLHRENTCEVNQHPRFRNFHKISSG
jgi:hypothetical protein